MDVHDQLDDLVDYVEDARSLPMSSSVVINRADLLAKLSTVRESLPASVAAADALLAEQEQLLAQATAEAERIVADGHAEQERLVTAHAVVAEAQRRAQETVAAATAQAERMRAETDEYVDAKLAHLEAAVDKILDTVRRGRDRLGRASSFDELARGDLGTAQRL